MEGRLPDWADSIFESAVDMLRRLIVCWVEEVTGSLVAGLIAVLSAWASLQPTEANGSPSLWPRVISHFFILWAAFSVILAFFIIWHKRRLEVLDLRNRCQEHVSTKIHGAILRFEELNAFDLSSEEFTAIYTKDHILRSTFLVYLQVENFGNSSRAVNWRYLLRRKNGAQLTCSPIIRSWNPPLTWPQIEYQRLSEIQNRYLEKGKLYNVFFHIQFNGHLNDVDVQSFEVHFQDLTGKNIVCRIQRYANSAMIDAGAT